MKHLFENSTLNAFEQYLMIEIASEVAIKCCEKAFKVDKENAICIIEQLQFEDE